MARLPASALPCALLLLLLAQPRLAAAGCAWPAGAQVQRSASWPWGDEDGGAGMTGEVVSASAIAGCSKRIPAGYDCAVSWPDSSPCGVGVPGSACSCNWFVYANSQLKTAVPQTTCYGASMAYFGGFCSGYAGCGYVCSPDGSHCAVEEPVCSISSCAVAYPNAVVGAAVGQCCDSISASGACVNPRSGMPAPAASATPTPTPTPTPTLTPTPTPPSQSSAWCGTVAEGASLSLVCGGGVFTGIQFASYGTPTGGCGGGFTASSCSAASSAGVVAGLCVGKSSCSIQATNAIFTDPCLGTGKSLSVSLLGSCSGMPTPRPSPSASSTASQAATPPFGTPSSGLPVVATRPSSPCVMGSQYSDLTSATMNGLSEQYGPCYLALDGSALTFLHTKFDSGDWVTIDLGVSTAVASFSITNRQDCCQERANGFRAFVGNSPDFAQNAQCDPSVMPTSMLQAPYQASFPCLLTGRYATISAINNNALNIAEISVLAANSCPVRSATGAQQVAGSNCVAGAGYLAVCAYQCLQGYTQVSGAATSTCNGRQWDAPALVCTSPLPPLQAASTTATPTVSLTSTSSQSGTGSITATPSPSMSPTATISTTSTASTTKTPTASDSTSPSQTPSPTPSQTATLSMGASPSQTPSQSPTTSLSPTISNSATGSFSPSWTPSASLTPSASATVSVTPSASVSPTPTVTMLPQVHQAIDEAVFFLAFPPTAPAVGALNRLRQDPSLATLLRVAVAHVLSADPNNVIVISAADPVLGQLYFGAPAAIMSPPGRRLRDDRALQGSSATLPPAAASDIVVMGLRAVSSLGATPPYEGLLVDQICADLHAALVDAFGLGGAAADSKALAVLADFSSAWGAGASGISLLKFVPPLAPPAPPPPPAWFTRPDPWAGGAALLVVALHVAWRRAYYRRAWWRALSNALAAYDSRRRFDIEVARAVVPLAGADKAAKKAAFKALLGGLLSHERALEWHMKEVNADADDAGLWVRSARTGSSAHRLAGQRLAASRDLAECLHRELEEVQSSIGKVRDAIRKIDYPPPQQIPQLGQLLLGSLACAAPPERQEVERAYEVANRKFDTHNPFYGGVPILGNPDPSSPIVLHAVRTAGVAGRVLPPALPARGGGAL